jgi:hypothetical protein
VQALRHQDRESGVLLERGAAGKRGEQEGALGREWKVGTANPYPSRKKMSQHFHTIRGSEGILHPGLTVSAISLHECLPQKMVQQIFVMLPAVSIRYKDLDLNQRFSLAPSLSQCIHAKPTVHAMPRNRIVVAQHI